jgi:hypothetical protein
MWRAFNLVSDNQSILAPQGKCMGHRWTRRGIHISMVNEFKWRVFSVLTSRLHTRDGLDISPQVCLKYPFNKYIQIWDYCYSYRHISDSFRATSHNKLWDKIMRTKNNQSDCGSIFDSLNDNVPCPWNMFLLTYSAHAHKTGNSQLERSRLFVVGKYINFIVF